MMIQFQTPSPWKPCGFQTLTDVVASTALTVPSGAQYALIQAEGADFRWKDDGNAPTTGEGMILPFHDSGTLSVPPVLFAGDLTALRFIELGTAGVLNVSYYKPTL